MRIPMSDVLRVAALSLVTIIALAVSWQLASAAAAQRGPAPAVTRVTSAARGVTESDRAGPDLAPALTARASAAGQMVVFAVGVPLTVVDGVLTIPLRVPRGTTVDEALALAGVSLRPLDRLALADRGDGSVASGDTIRVVRVSDSQTVVQEPIAFGVNAVSDATLPVGRAIVATAGVPGIAQNTYRVRTADGVEESRTLIVSLELAAPVAEVRRVGAFVPAASGDIAGIIRAAAAKYGADETQLLRVAYCESRYNPNAYNASSGASGLFQFLAGTWAVNSIRAGYAGAGVFDPVANANTAAYMFANQQARQWACK
jgi:G5 domain/Transglycosylase SLT domain